MPTTATERRAIEVLCTRAAMALTTYDTKREACRDYNPSALAAYLGVVAEAREQPSVAAARRALLDGFFEGSHMHKLMERLPVDPN